MHKKRLVIGITGASGTIYGIRILQALRKIESIETHLIVSDAAAICLSHEVDMSLNELKSLADVVYDIDHFSASIASGSFKTMGMIIAPCSVKTLSCISNSLSLNLIVRAADVCLKERRKLLLMVRETPFHLGHLRAMTNVTEMGALIMPPLPAFYTKPQSLDDIVNHSVGRALDYFDIEVPGFMKRWGEDISIPDKTLQSCS